MSGKPHGGAMIVPFRGDGDPVFARMRSEAEEVIRREPEVAGFIYSTVLNHSSLESVIIHRVAARLSHQDLPSALIRPD